MISWIYPPKCVACSTILLPTNDIENFFCEHCKTIFLQIEPPFCPRCGMPSSTTCLSCVSRKSVVEKHRAAFIYEGVVQELIRDMKFRSRKRAANALGHLLAIACANWEMEGDYIVPVPLHRSKLRKRGYNQAAVLAAPIAKQLNIPHAPHMLKRTRKTPPQSGLTPSAREQNLVNAFAFNTKKYDVTNKKIFLVDDIFTTGSTMNACAQMLLNHGAARVEGISLSIVVRNE